MSWVAQYVFIGNIWCIIIFYGFDKAVIHQLRIFPMAVDVMIESFFNKSGGISIPVGGGISCVHKIGESAYCDHFGAEESLARNKSDGIIGVERLLVGME